MLLWSDKSLQPSITAPKDLLEENFKLRKIALKMLKRVKYFKNGKGSLEFQQK